MKDEFLPLSRLVPSLVTMLALCSGMTAVKMAIAHRFDMAIAMVLMAAFLDGIDGRVARVLHSDSCFGAELDSLCDLVNFGVAPGFILYFWHFSTIEVLGWGAVLFSAICMATRLARFNAMLNIDDDYAALRKKFFLGIPAPMGGILLLMPLILDLAIKHDMLIQNNLIITYHCAISILVASRVPTFSGKGIAVSRKSAAFVLVIFGIVVIMMAQEPFCTIIGLAILYTISIPLSIGLYFFLARKIRQSQASCQIQIQSP